MTEQQLKKIIDKSTPQIQKVIAIEELSELQKEITKDLRGEGSKEHIGEEIADCLIMINQLINMYDIDKISLEVIIDEKIERTMKRLGIKENEKNTIISN